MKVQNYLKNRLQTCSLYQPTVDDKEFLNKKGIEEFLYKKLTSKKFRKWKLAPECVERTKKAINLQVVQNQPLRMVFPAGGYKLWRLPSWPEVDWAEFFNLVYVLNYLAPIMAVYKPGATLSYYLHTLLMEKHDNLTTQEINQYVNSFQKLIDYFAQYFPKNLKVKIWKDADIYPRQEYFKELEAGYKKAKPQFEALSAEGKETELKASRFNIKWQGKEDWSEFSKKEKEEKLKDGVIYEIAAVYHLPKVAELVKAKQNILIFTRASQQFIGIGTTKNSIVKHWTGVGVLEQVGDKLCDRVLSPSQIEKAKQLKYRTVKTTLIPLKNFKEIWVYPQKFNFIGRRPT